jgi:hypothetical protein
MYDLIFTYTFLPSIVMVLVFIKMYLMDRITCKAKTYHTWAKWELQDDKKSQIRSCSECGFSQKEIV